MNTNALAETWHDEPIDRTIKALLPHMSAPTTILRVGDSQPLRASDERWTAGPYDGAVGRK